MLTLKSSEFSYANTIYDAVLPLALIFCVIYFLIELTDCLTREGFTAEQFIRMLIKLAMSVILVEHIDMFVVAICNVSNFLVDKLKFTFIDVATTNIWTLLEHGNVISALIAFIVSIIMIIVKGVISVLISVHIIKVKIEIIIKAGLSPLGVADLVAGGMHSSAIKAIKGFATTTFQLVVIQCCFAISSQLNLVGGILANTANVLFSVITAIVSYGLMKSAEHIAKDIF